MIPRDKLIEQLAEEASSSQDVAQDPTLAQLKAELETVESRIRQPAPVDPVVDESECQAAVGRIIELGRDISAATRDAMNQQPSVSATSPLGVLGQYQLLEKLGEGGMGAVYKAVHSRLERVVAVKVLPANRMQDAQAVGRFQREMRAVGKLQHPNIIAAHDAGEIDGTHYLVMELVEGIDLGKLVNRLGPLPINAACELVRQAALGLQHAYEHNLVHRDIKPSNLMLAAPSNSKASPTVKILDLGLALLEGGQLEANELTSTGQVMGTIDYMAPEQGTDTHGVDIRADIYSLGATLYKLLSGQTPFSDPQYATPIKKLMALATKAPKPIEFLRPDCPPQLAQLVGRMLAKSPEERPTPPEELASLLEPFAQGADLRALLAVSDKTQAVPSPPNDAAVMTHQTADDPTFLVASQTAGPVTVSQPTPPRPRRRLWLIGGGAFTLIIAAIIAISASKGEGTIEIEAPDDLVGQVQVNVVREGREFKHGWQLKPGAGNTLTVSSGNVDVRLPDDNNEYELLRPNELVVRRGNAVIFKLRRKQARTSVDLANNPKTSDSPTTSAPETASLDQWLKGRTILTVAQDGSGRFRTIQEALLALQPGQVVRVLDRGPYRERLDIGDLPSDSGLISTVQTIIESPDWKYLWDTDDGQGGKEPMHGAHLLGNADGFRLYGFELRFVPHSHKAAHRLTAGGARDFTLENCALRAHESQLGDTLDFGNWGDKLSSGMRVTVRDCVIEGTLSISGFEGRSEAVVERNEFVSRKNQQYLILAGPNMSRIRLRENVFRSASDTPDDVVFIKSERCELLEATNNTFGGERSLVFSGSLPQEGVSIRNNLQARPGLLLVTTSGAEQQQPLIAARWNVDHNSARKIPEGVSSIVVPLQPGDFENTPRLLSKDPLSPDYLRIAADDPLANAGAGGSWPTYIGALRPGPTPKDGDWFTRLRERWEGAKSTSHTFVKEPLAITDPPPLDEWLKGRTILTVAQDGSGKFKTIQAALNVVQPGNVIKVLDKGPYRERLHRSDIPPDTGLVTEVGTEIETPDRGEYVDGGGGRYLAGHIFEGAREFRVSGFTWVPLPKTYSDPPVPNVDVRFAFPHGLVFEQCLFRGRSPIAELQVMIWSDLGICCVRECRFEGTLAFSEGQNVLVTRNEFDFPGPYAAISVGSANQRPRKLAIRHNIFRGQKNQVILVGDLGRGLEISNNTFQNPFPIVVFNPVLGAEVSICNNIHFGKGLLVFEQNGDLLRAGTEWNIRSNCLAAELVPGVYGWNASQIFPKSQADMIGEPQQLSFNQENPHFSRIAANDPIVQKGVGGAWPGYLGALPPGPAPKEGDWFTRLCERCNASRPTLSKTTHEPMPITQPPSLDDWLKGRTILTVAQDGSGQFKTIQEALNAMQSGEAVQVLDRGPYLEQLDLKCPPDCGLISKVRTVIAPPKAILTGDGRSVGHYFRRTNGFRLHGFAFRLPEIKDQLGLVFDDRPGGVVIEQCQFRASHLATMSDGCAAVYLHSGPKGISKPTIIRNCRFDGRLMINGEDNMDDRDVLVLRNYFTGYDSELTPLALIHGFRSLEVRENVIKGSTVSFSTLEGSHAIDVIRNTFVGDINLSVFGSMPERMRFEGNLVCDYGKISVAADLPTERIKAWELKQNYFQGELGDWPETIRVPLGPTDKVAPIRFLSKIPSNHDYLRLAKDEKAVPPGVGALAQGSAPEEGDWFSRLQENWFDTESNSQ